MPIKPLRLLLLACCFMMACQSSGPTTGGQPTPIAAPLTAGTATPAPGTGPATPIIPAARDGLPTAVPTASPSGGAAAASPIAAKPTAPAAPASPVACGYGQSRKLAETGDRAIKEASALVASQRWPGVYWTLNDSGNSPSIFAIDEQGRSRGTFRVDDAENEDWESMQLGPGPNGSTALYIGDIGDNDGKRKEITVYRVPEPEPIPVGAKTNSGRTPAADAFRFAYPDGGRDAEALLVHPKTGEMLIVTKESLGRALVYRAPQPLDSRKRVTLERVADVDLSKIGVKIDVVNDGTVAADARRVTIRTYGSALEFDVAPDAPLASIWGQTPRVTRLTDGIQAESITYRHDGKALISIGEGVPAVLFETLWQC